jgi:hypothetical protein
MFETNGTNETAANLENPQGSAQVVMQVAVSDESRSIQTCNLRAQGGFCSAVGFCGKHRGERQAL